MVLNLKLWVWHSSICNNLLILHLRVRKRRHEVNFVITGCTRRLCLDRRIPQIFCDLLVRDGACSQWSTAHTAIWWYSRVLRIRSQLDQTVNLISKVWSDQRWQHMWHVDSAVFCCTLCVLSGLMLGSDNKIMVCKNGPCVRLSYYSYSLVVTSLKDMTDGLLLHSQGGNPTLFVF